MANPALTAVLAAAAQKHAGKTAIPEQLKKAKATNPRSAIELDLTAEGSDLILKQYVRHGHVRATGNGRYWLDEAAVSRSNAQAGRILLILLAFSLSAGLTLWVLLR